MPYLSLIILSLALLAGCNPGVQTAPTARLSLTTTPAGATVALDGREIGTTPLQQPIASGQHMLEVSLNGYETAWHKFNAKSSQAVSLHLPLAPVEATVLVTSTPKGAILTLNGADKGATPAFLAQLPIGTYEAELTAPGYSPKRFSFQVENARPKQIRQTLESLMATLEVWSNPGGATIEVDGKIVGATPEDEASPLIINNLTAGTYTVTARKAGYRDVNRPLLLQSRQRNTLRLPPMPAMPGSIEIVSTPSQASVYDSAGELLGTTPVTLGDLTAGQLSLVVRKDGFVPQKRRVNVSPGTTKQLHVVLSKFAVSIAFITEPPGCSVFVDNRSVGKTAPSDNPLVSELFEVGELMPGPHRIELHHPAYLPFSRHVLIRPGETIALGRISLTKRWLPTHRLTLVSGSVYEGILVRHNPDKSLVFETSPTVKVEYQAEEILSLIPLTKAENGGGATGTGR